MFEVKVINEKDEEGNMVFQKIIESPEELKFYNPDYFGIIGFADAIILLSGNAEEPLQSDEMKGGYYSNVEELSWPFRQFVYFVQTGEGEVQKSIPEKDENYNGIYGMLFPTANKSLKPKNNVNEFYNNIMDYFRNNKTPEEKTTSFFDNNVPEKPPVEKPKSLFDFSEPDKPIENPVEKPKSLFDFSEPDKPIEPENQKSLLDKYSELDNPIILPKPQVSEPEKPVGDPFGNSEPVIPETQVKASKEVKAPAQSITDYLLGAPEINRDTMTVTVKIPILSPDTVFSELKIREERLRFDLRSPLKIEGKEYIVGNRFIVMCEKVKGKSSFKDMISSSNEEMPKGTLMAKYNHLKTFLSTTI
jgi:hypothetical protein